MRAQPGQGDAVTSRSTLTAADEARIAALVKKAVS
jgi:hypothetical protein